VRTCVRTSVPASDVLCDHSDRTKVGSRSPTPPTGLRYKICLMQFPIPMHGAEQWSARPASKQVAAWLIGHQATVGLPGWVSASATSLLSRLPRKGRSVTISLAMCPPCIQPHWRFRRRSSPDRANSELSAGPTEQSFSVRQAHLPQHCASRPNCSWSIHYFIFVMSCSWSCGEATLQQHASSRPILNLASDARGRTDWVAAPYALAWFNT